MDDTIRYLDRATVTRLLPPLDEQLDLVEATYVEMARGRVEQPPKLGVHARPETFIHAMPAYLEDDDVVAVKWVAAYSSNSAKGLPYISGLMILSDPDTGLPMLVMDAAQITAVRTAVASGVSIRHLAPTGWRRVAILGYGEQGHQHARVVHALNPDAEITVYGGPRLSAPQAGVEVAPDARSAVEGADVVITAGPMAAKPGPMVEASWVAPKSLVVPVDFDAYVAASVVEQSDQLVVDDTAQYDQYRARGGFAGWPDADTTIGEALQGEVTGERRVVCNLGVGALDAALAGVVRKRAEAEGIGMLLPR